MSAMRTNDDPDGVLHVTDSRAHVALLVDIDALAAASPSLAVGDAVKALVRYAGGVGRVTVSRAYADWSKRPTEEALAVHAAHVVPVLVPAGPEGEERAHVRLTVDALQALFAGGEPDAFVVASGDARLLPLLQAIRADGSDVLLVVPAGAASDEMRAQTDVVATVEDALAGAVGRPSEARTEREEDEDVEEEVEAPAPAPPPRAPRAERFERPDRRNHDAPRGGGFGRSDEGRGGFGRSDEGRGGFGRAPMGSMGSTGSMGAMGRGGRERFAPKPPPGLNLENYDWGAFVKLIDELEHRLPFVGVRYLVNKVLGPRNCGIDDPRQKRDLINRSVDDGIVEMYEVGNVEDRRDPVTACRLDRRNPRVIAVLGAETTTPVVVEAKDGEPVDNMINEQEAEAAAERAEMDDAD